MMKDLRIAPATGSQRRMRPALTIAELVVSMAVMGVLLMGLASAMLIASHALPHNSTALQTSIDSAAVVNQICDELSTALWVMEHTPSKLTFTVADRDGDNVPERISYEWAGSLGDPLVRTYNGSAPVALIEDTREFVLDYSTFSVSEKYPGPPVESAEQELVTHSWPEASWGEFDVSRDDWIGQHLTPSLASDALSWRITYIQFRAAVEGKPASDLAVQVRRADANGKPQDEVVSEQIIPESSLPDPHDWVSASFDDASGLSPSQGACLVFANASGKGDAGSISYDDNAGSGAMVTSNGGDSWYYSTNDELVYYVYGTVLTPSPDQAVTRTYLSDVHIRLRAGADTAATITAGTPLLNQPELLSAYWQLDFTVDPREDLNGDGYADWAHAGSGSIDLQALIDAGTFHAGGELYSTPECAFTDVTTVELAFRDTQTSGSGASFGIAVDWDAGACAPFIATINLLANNTQTLKVDSMKDAVTSQRLVEIAGLPAGLVTLRLLFDPDQDTVNIKVNDVEYNTHTYNCVTATGGDRAAATISPDATGSEYSYLSIRVGE